jgi:hypothetical protein
LQMPSDTSVRLRPCLLCSLLVKHSIIWQYRSSILKASLNGLYRKWKVAEFLLFWSHTAHFNTPQIWIHMSQFHVLCRQSACKINELGCGFETRWGEWFLWVYLILPATLGPGVHSASNRNEYQKHKNNVSGE